ncbi:hypothetical protein BJ875DRAFT_454249 [Amylocarpus encephaloides]|uniref:Uncharacterized protein n=1 Tax=Amylocarpus encephaloides TaxID=45428 RepID=A0A9P7YNV2_9HELO|nr:hypothetical protein BJ875DRAFT_454249 [Amylocarpus encephaloides]
MFACHENLQPLTGAGSPTRQIQCCSLLISPPLPNCLSLLLLVLAYWPLVLRPKSLWELLLRALGNCSARQAHLKLFGVYANKEMFLAQTCRRVLRRFVLLCGESDLFEGSSPSCNIDSTKLPYGQSPLEYKDLGLLDMEASSHTRVWFIAQSKSSCSVNPPPNSHHTRATLQIWLPSTQT